MSDKETAAIGVLEDVLRARGVRLPVEPEATFTAVGPPEDPDSVIEFRFKLPTTITLPTLPTRTVAVMAAADRYRAAWEAEQKARVASAQAHSAWSEAWHDGGKIGDPEDHPLHVPMLAARKALAAAEQELVEAKQGLIGAAWSAS